MTEPTSLQPQNILQSDAASFYGRARGKQQLLILQTLASNTHCSDPSSRSLRIDVPRARGALRKTTLRHIKQTARPRPSRSNTAKCNSAPGTLDGSICQCARCPSTWWLPRQSRPQGPRINNILFSRCEQRKTLGRMISQKKNNKSHQT